MTARLQRPVPLERHGMSGGRSGSKGPEYRAWAAMIYRCTTPSCKHWHNYGGRGISVYPAWRWSFATFFQDVGPRPSAKHSLDRIDNNGHYVPSNVRWTSRVTQNSNRRDCKPVEYEGERISVYELARRTGLPPLKLLYRIRLKGMPVGDALDLVRKEVSSCV